MLDGNSHNSNDGYLLYSHQNSELIEEIVMVHEQGSIIQADTGNGITRYHWINSDTRTNCSKKSCKKKFTLFDRPHHCRRCGGVFCLVCTKYKRKLNKLANPDPDGEEYRVCQACYDVGPQQHGQTRNLLGEFYEAKEHVKYTRQAQALGQRRAGWRSRLDLKQECTRLREGFKKELHRSELSKALSEMKVMVTVPDWQKSPCWLQEDLSTKCQQCNSQFNLILKKKHHCRVCGLAVCNSCSPKKVILYMPNETNGVDDLSLSIEEDSLSLSTKESEPKLSVIEIVGCPETEPKICIYLRVCSSCRETLTDMQVESHRLSLTPDEDLFLSKLSDMQKKFADLKTKVQGHLDEYRETVESLENNNVGSGAKGVKSQDNMKSLAKAQTDLSDYFSSYIMHVQQLKQLKSLSTTAAKAKLLQNFIKCKCEYYMENMFLFRAMRSKLASVSPPDVLEIIQRIMDRDAIVSTHLYVKQLLFETMALTDKYKVLEQLPTILFPSEQALESEAEACLRREGEDCVNHKKVLQQLLEIQLKEHKLIRPSQRRTTLYGASHILEIMHQRSLEAIQQVRLQLMLKSAHNSFQKSKEALHQCEKAISSL